MANGYLHHQGTKFYPAPFYPVGSIFISATYFNPSTYFGGTWVQLKNAFLYASGNTSGTGSSGNGTGTSTGGNSSNTGSTKLTAAQSGRPSYKVTGNWMRDTGVTGAWGCTINQVTSYNYTAEPSGIEIPAVAASEGHYHSLNNHTHTIPYISVFVWKRTA